MLTAADCFHSLLLRQRTHRNCARSVVANGVSRNEQNVRAVHCVVEHI
jgi:hypothetical protein